MVRVHSHSSRKRASSGVDYRTLRKGSVVEFCERGMYLVVRVLRKETREELGGRMIYFHLEVVDDRQRRRDLPLRNGQCLTVSMNAARLPQGGGYVWSFSPLGPFLPAGSNQKATP